MTCHSQFLWFKPLKARFDIPSTANLVQRTGSFSDENPTFPISYFISSHPLASDSSTKDPFHNYTANLLKRKGSSLLIHFLQLNGFIQPQYGISSRSTPRPNLHTSFTIICLTNKIILDCQDKSPTLCDKSSFHTFHDCWISEEQ